MSDTLSDADRLLLATAGVRCCNTCSRAFTRTDDPTFRVCGAPVDDGALADDLGTNPIWAERKYGRQRLMAMLITGAAPSTDECMDPERMPGSDGAHCALWRSLALDPRADI